MQLIFILGASFFVLSAFIWGRERGLMETEALRLTEGILEFIEYTEEQISTFRTPLLRIYDEFFNEALESTSRFLGNAFGNSFDAIFHAGCVLNGIFAIVDKVLNGTLGGRNRT